ncbi:MAG: hypothetical protein AAF629_05500 [Chloroflexota bacterium]
MSCQMISSLAERCPSRYVMICEHDVVHTTWDCMTLHFQVDDFREFVRVMHQMRVSCGYPSEVCDNYEAIINSRPETERGPLRLRISSMWVSYAPLHFLLLTDMIQEALHALDNHDRKEIDTGALIVHNYHQVTDKYQTLN